MLLFKISSILPEKPRSSLVLIATQDKIIDIASTERDHNGTELASFQLYRVFYIDISTGETSFLSFFSSDLPHETLTLPLYKNFSDDFLNSDSATKTENTLVVTVTQSGKENPFFEEDLRYSIENQPRIDDEPLVNISTRRTSLEYDSMISGILSTQVKNYKEILEFEKTSRKNLEKVLEESKIHFDSKIAEIHLRENRLLKLLEDKEDIIVKLIQKECELEKEINKLSVINFQLTEKFESATYELSMFKKLELDKEVAKYKKIIEDTEKKWNEFSSNVHSYHDTDPIHFIIKEKDEKISELNNRISELAKNSMEVEIENELSKRNLRFIREEELVYLIENSKFAIGIDNHTVFFRSVGNPKLIDEITLLSPQKRSNSAIRTEGLKTIPFRRSNKLGIFNNPTRSPNKY